ncbi:unnamed protein product [Alopecurus aequalis]
MAAQVSKQELGTVLVQAMLAQKNIRTQRERLLELLRRLQQQLSPSDNYVGAGLKELALDVEHIDLAIADYLDRACTLASLAVKHIDLAVDVISSFLDPKEVASLSEYTDRAAVISEVAEGASNRTCA